MRTPIPHASPWPLLIAILFLFVSSGLSLAETAPAFIQTELKKNEKIWPGQKQTLYIKLYTTSSFSGSTRFELPKVSGMLIMESEDRPLLGTETIDTVSYIFKQHEITLFPQRVGSITVPGFTVEFGFRMAEGKIVEQSFTTDDLQLIVKEIPGADPERPVVTTTRLHIDDRWEPVPDKVKVGDAFTRTITMTADDLPGMAFPPFNVQTIKGLGVYTKQPQVADQMQRGEFTGKRIEMISYVCEQEGSFTVAETRIQWWNPKSESLQDIVLDAVKIKVNANPLLQQDGVDAAKSSATREFTWKWMVTFFLFFALAGAAFIWQRRKIKLHSSNVTDKENELFKKFHKASASHDPVAIMQALLHWLDYSNFTGNSGNLRRFIELADDPELGIQIQALETTLYATSQKQWSGDKLYSAVQRARKKLKKYPPPALQHSLPELNP